MAIHWLPVAFDLYFGQFCSFSAQIGLVLKIPIRLLRIGQFASGFSHVSKGVINYKNFPR
jgi:hypothetical protein